TCVSTRRDSRFESTSLGTLGCKANSFTCKGLVRLAGFEPATCCSGDKPEKCILLARLAFSCVLYNRNAWCSGDFVPKMFPFCWPKPRLGSRWTDLIARTLDCPAILCLIFLRQAN